VATVYRTLQDALDVAAENTTARKELARRGVNHIIVADVVPDASGYSLRAVTVESWGGWTGTSTQHIVVQSSSLQVFHCPVCTRTGEQASDIVSPVMRGVLIVGLDPEHCVGCHDTLTTRGAAPLVVRTCVPASVPRPE
jgi:hypothetical protein